MKGKKLVKGLVAGLLIASSLCTIGNSVSDWKEKKDAEEPKTDVSTEAGEDVE